MFSKIYISIYTHIFYKLNELYSEETHIIIKMYTKDGSLIFWTLGWLMDYTGNTYSPCYIFGPTQILGGFLIAIIPYIKKNACETYVANDDVYMDSGRNIG